MQLRVRRSWGAVTHWHCWPEPGAGLALADVWPGTEAHRPGRSGRQDAGLPRGLWRGRAGWRRQRPREPSLSPHAPQLLGFPEEGLEDALRGRREGMGAASAARPVTCSDPFWADLRPHLSHVGLDARVPPPTCGSCSGGANDPWQAEFLFCGSELRLPAAPGSILDSSQPAGASLGSRVSPPLAGGSGHPRAQGGGGAGPPISRFKAKGETPPQILPAPWF